MQVSAAAFRKLPGLSPAPQPLPQDILQPGKLSLKIPECSDPAAMSTTGLFRPCEPIATATARTAPVDPHDPAKGHAVQLHLELNILPGLPALAGLEQRCLYTDAFALGGDAAEVHLAARDSGDSGLQYAGSCSAGAALQQENGRSGAVGEDTGGAVEVQRGGVLLVLCRCGGWMGYDCCARTRARRRR